MRYVAGVGDDGCYVSVGRATHGPFTLDAAYARNIQVLVHSNRVAKPANVADVHHHGGCSRRVNKPGIQLFAKQVFITNIGRDTLALPVSQSVWPPFNLCYISSYAPSIVLFWLLLVLKRLWR